MKIKNKIFLSLFLFVMFIAVGQTNGQTNGKNKKPLKLNLDKALQLALTNNTDIKIEKISFTEKKWALITSWNTFFPSITLSTSLSKLNGLQQDMTVDTSGLMTGGGITMSTVDGDEYPWSVGLNFRLSLNLNASQGFSIYKAYLDWKMEKNKLERTTKKIELDVKKKFYNLLLQKEDLSIKEAELKASQDTYKQVKTLYDNGMQSEYDMLSAKVSWENLKPQYLDKLNNYNNSLSQFKQMLGLTDTSKIEIVGTIETKDFDELDDNIQSYIDMIEQRIDMQDKKLSLKSLQNTRNMTICSLTPTVSLSYSMDPSFQKDALKDNWFGDSDYMSENWKQRSGMFAFSISLPLGSWLPFSSTQMNLVNSIYEIQKSKLQLVKSHDEAKIQIIKLYNTVKKSIQSIESLKLNVKLSQRAYDIALAGYREGNKTLLELQNSQIALNRAKLNLLNEKYRFVTGILDIEYSVLIGDPNSVQMGGLPSNITGLNNTIPTTGAYSSMNGGKPSGMGF